MQSGLPIDSALPRLREALRAGPNAVLVAPPGAGKSTVVPLALLEEPWAQAQKIIVLEPRRVAARAVAARMAATLGERSGETVGYRMRLETRVGPRTRIEVVTEGVLTRMLQSDPSLDGVAALLFDEFHERNLHADLGLALALDAQTHIAPALKLLVMSATLDGARVAALLGGAPVVECSGRMHPVSIEYVGKGLPILPGVRGAGGGAAALTSSSVGPPEPLEAVTARVVERALAEAPGDALVFLPGVGEIKRLGARLAEALDAGVDVVELHGDLTAEAQDAALAPPRPGRRKIVLATNIAETSVTIDGVRIVVDTGLERRQVFDPVSGMSRRETQRIARASAEQRTGRAGRTAPGVCYRIWSESAERSLAAHAPAEIVTADLAPLALELAVWGTNASALRWLDAPPAATLDSARDLLRRLGALDETDRVTPHGRAMHALGAHPRLAHMLLAAQALGAQSEAAELAALLSERDLLRGAGRGSGGAAAGSGGARDSDMRTRLEVLRRGGNAPGVSRGALERVRRTAQGFERLLHGNAGARAGNAGVRRGNAGAPSSGRGDGTPARRDTSGRGVVDVGLLLAFAYPDRIGKRRAGADARYQLANGRGASFAEPESIAREELIVAVDLDDRERDARILLAAPLARADLLAHFADRIEQRDEIAWDARTEAVTARRVLRYGELVLEEKPLHDPPPGAAEAALLEGLRALGLDALPWTDDALDFAARCELVRKLEGAGCDDWPAFTAEALLVDLSWLEPYLAGMSRRAHLSRVPLLDALRARLGHSRLRTLDALAPTHVELPTGTRARIDYRDDNAPCASMRMQEVFGLAETPRIGGGRVPVTFKLLSPAQRPLQVTRDLASFWRNAYVDVRKDMRGRYPKHYWPEDPLAAEPTRRVRPRSS